MANQPNVQISPDFEKRFPNSSARATESAMNLVLTADLLVKKIGELLQPLKLTPSAGLVLSVLVDSEGPLPPNEIARRLIISRASATSLIDTLERQGFVRRRPHPTDRRMLLVEITRKGREVTEEFRPLVHRYQKTWFQNLNGEEKGQLIGFLHRIQDSLVEDGAK